MNPDPFAIIRAAAGDVPGLPSGDLFTGSEPVDVAAANQAAQASATEAPATATMPPAPAVAVSENVIEEAVLALDARLRLIERMARQNGWSL